MTNDLPDQLIEYGASPSQLVDLAAGAGPRTLRYIDLIRTPAAGSRPPVVYESHGQPLAYVFDDRQPGSDSLVSTWIRRVTFRGDADWVGVLRPGRLDIYRATVPKSGAPRPLANVGTPSLLLPTLVQRTPDRAAGVRARLLELLRVSIKQAKELGVGSNDALSLVGRALFWRFLIDRGLLEGLERDRVCPGAASWPACLETKAHAARTFEWLDGTFNGSLLPLETALSLQPDTVFRRVLGNIAHLATPDGQLPLRLPKDWSEVNFAHVPVGLLSEVYEAFAHDELGEQAKAESVFYTPRHIAEFMVEEALDSAPSDRELRILDPAAGAGVFLVAAFRALVAREWRATGKRPSRSVVRRILNQQLTGLDINGAALRLAELALYLTAIELDPETRPRPLSLLRFDAIRDRILFQVPGGPDEGSLAPVAPALRHAFDVVVGNPPWTAQATTTAKARWVATTRPVVAERLGRERAAEFDFPDTNPDLPFVYRALEWGKPGAIIALVTNARWLFGQSDPAVRARNDLLACVHVTGVLNGTALRDTSVWPNVRHPFCLLFAVNEVAPQDAAFLFVSPDLDHVPDRGQRRMRIDWQDAREAEVKEVIRVPWALKMRFRGTPFDEALLGEVMGKGKRLGDYLRSLGTELCNGYQVGGAAGVQQPASDLHGLPDLKGSRLTFIVDVQSLPAFTRPTLLRPRARSRYSGPLLLVHESMRVGVESPRASISLDDVLFDERFDGASFARVQDGLAVAEYLQLVIQSSYFVHALLMLDGQFGVEREVVHLEGIERVPVVPWDVLSSNLQAQGRALSKRLRVGITAVLRTEIDHFVFRTFGLSKVLQESIFDTLATALPTFAGKGNAVRPTTSEERDLFARICERELCEVLAHSGRVASVRPHGGVSGSPWQILQVHQASSAETAFSDPVDMRRFVEAADDAAASLVTVRMSASTTLVGILDHYKYWTRTRARMLASALLSERDHDA